MDQAAIATVMDSLFDQLTRCLDVESARRIVAYRVSPEVQAQVDVLAERANEGLQTPEERAKYEAFVNTLGFIAVLKLKVRQQLKSNGS
jgi:hypothetical protein